MGKVRCLHCIGFCCLSALFVLELQFCTAKAPNVGKIYRGFAASQTNWVDNDGFFLVSNNSAFALGFYPIFFDASLFSLVLIHRSSSRVVWTANRGSQVRDNDPFVFDKIGNAYLENETCMVWSTNTSGRGVTAMELQDTGNLVLVGDNNGAILWQSFSYPTDTLLSGQKFERGMKLRSFPHHNNLFHYLEIESGDLILYAGYQNPQVYWSMSHDSRKIIKIGNGKVYSALLLSNSWNLYDQNEILIWQFNFSETRQPNATWAAVLGTGGSISFYNLETGRLASPEPTKIPRDSCCTPEPCEPYNVCGSDIRCVCPSTLSSYPDCKPQISFTCNSSKNLAKLLSVGTKLDYFAIRFLNPSLKTNLIGCRTACLNKCSCHVVFFDDSTGNCYLFDQIGSLQLANVGSNGFSIYIKVSNDVEIRADPKPDERNRSGKRVLIIVMIVVPTVVVILFLLYLGFLLFRHSRKNILESFPDTSSQEDNLFEGIYVPTRFSYDELDQATGNFSKKLGQGGFGSVYYGVLPEGTQVAVKKLESIGQGKKEFRAEVNIIGSIRHVHLVKLKGFCSEQTHRLLVYEYMEKGSLDRWIFKNNKEGHILDWEARFNIALGTAKGLAYLHEECDGKIIHCDIKPENVLLHNDFVAKVSDFGLARLMTREQSHVYTAVRGTRGYLAPEWITNHALSEKTDVYSYGMVLLEIIGGRKNYEPYECSEKVHYPTYAFKMMEAGKLKEIIDPKLVVDENDERVINAIKVALWCIQDDMHIRPSMTKVVQMLEGLCEVNNPPKSFQISALLYSSFSKSSGEGTSSILTDQCSSHTILSDNILSGPR